MSVRDQLLDDLSRAPDDWKLRNVLADWFDDNNHPEEAACVRWMAAGHKRPYHNTTSPISCWFNAAKVSRDLGDPESDLPGEWYAALKGGKVTANHRTYDTMRAAEFAAIAAWLAARKKGWTPPPAAPPKAAKADKPAKKVTPAKATKTEPAPAAEAAPKKKTAPKAKKTPRKKPE